MMPKYSWFIFLLCLFLLSRASRAEPAALRPEESRDVFAVVIGVSQYETGNLPGTAEDAHLFASKINATFAIKRLWLLADPVADKDSFGLEEERQPPTIANIQNVLFSELPEAATKKALIIFYYSGHGKRLAATDNASGRGQLMLIAQGGSLASPWGKCVSLQEVLASIQMTEETVFMSFLDCCNSAPDVTSTREIQSKLDAAGIRGFGMAACATRQNAQVVRGPGGVNGLFTLNLLAALDEAGGNRDCMRPRDLETSVRNAIQRTTPNAEMRASLFFGKDFNACVPRLGRRGCFVFFEIAPALQGPFTFTIDHSRDPEFDSRDDLVSEQSKYSVYCRYVEQSGNPVEVSVEMAGAVGQEKIVVTLEPADLLAGVYVVRIGAFAPQAAVGARIHTAEIARGLASSDVESMLLLDAAGFAAADPVRRRAILASALRIKPEDVVFQYLASEPDDQSRFQLNDLLAQYSAPDLARILLRAGDFQGVRNLSETAFNEVSDPLDRAFLAGAWLTSARQLNDRKAVSAAQTVFESLDFSVLTERQRTDLIKLYSTSAGRDLQWPKSGPS